MNMWLGRVYNTISFVSEVLFKNNILIAVKMVENLKTLLVYISWSDWENPKML